MTNQNDEVERFVTLVASLHGAVRAQLDATASEVERHAMGLARDIITVHRAARHHRERAVRVFERLLSLEDRSSLVAELAEGREALLEEIFGDELEEQSEPVPVVDRLIAYTKRLGQDLRRQDEDHLEILRHTEPMVAALQLFDSIRQLVEHSGDAVARMIEPLRGDAASARLAEINQVLESLYRRGLGEIYFTEAEQRVLTKAVPDYAAPVHDHRTQVGGAT